VLLIVLGQAFLFRCGVMLRYGLMLKLAFHRFVRFYEQPVRRRRFRE
jgi:hypothetical protein